MEQQELPLISHEVVCISNLSVRRINMREIDTEETKTPTQYNTIMLLTIGQIQVTCESPEDGGEDLAVYVAPSIVVLEKDFGYKFKSLTEVTELYDVSALRDNSGDVVNPENLVREDYPFDTTKPFEKSIKI